MTCSAVISPAKKPKTFCSTPGDPRPSAPPTLNKPNGVKFKEFSQKAMIEDFNGFDFPIPRPEPSYNDDVELPIYEGALRSYHGTQRKGIRDEHPDSSSVADHITGALQAPFFLAQQTPLPESLRESIEFSATSPKNKTVTFWNDQINRIEAVARNHRALSEKWLDRRPSSLKGLKSVNVLLLAALMKAYGIKGQKWIKQCIFGFPITGTLSQKGAYPVDKRVKADTLSRHELLKSAHLRFMERAKGANPLNHTELWNEALDQCKKGWLDQPVPVLNNNGELIFEQNGLNPAFRFSVPQGDKNRACDDFRHSCTNQACAVLTPIRLISWDHVSAIANEYKSHGALCHFFKCDHKSAYKALPVDPDQSKLAVIVLRSPTDGKYYAFFSRTLLFGSTASVLHYNIFARIVTELCNKIFGIPLISFFDDFGCLMRPDLLREALRTFQRFCNALNVVLKTEKTEAGQRITFLGLLGDFPSFDNGGRLAVCLTAEKASAWCNLVLTVLKEGRISHQVLEGLIGKLSFSQAALFGKFARSQMRVLYRKLYRKIYCSQISLRERAVLTWRCAIFHELHPRVTREVRRFPDFVLYSDAASTHSRIAAILFKGGQSGAPLIELLNKGSTPKFWTRLFHRTNLIYGLELLALLGFVFANRRRLRNSSINAYLDNNNALCALIRGDSNTAVIADMVAVFWMVLQKYGIDIWLGRVSSKLNIADHPTRTESSLPYEVLLSAPYTELFKLAQIVLRAKDHIFNAIPW